MSLQSRGYVATPTDIEKLAREILHARTLDFTARGEFLRAVAATTIDRLGARQRQRTGTGDPLTEKAKGEQLEALETVYKPFYAAVVKAAKESMTERGEAGSKKLNAETTFARSSVTALRNWIRAGNDITLLAASRLKRDMLKVDTGRKRAASPNTLERQTLKAAETLTGRAKALAAADKDMAIKSLQTVMQAIAGMLLEIGSSPTTKSDVATVEHRPLKIGADIFWPASRPERAQLRLAS